MRRRESKGIGGGGRGDGTEDVCLRLEQQTEDKHDELRREEGKGATVESRKLYPPLYPLQRGIISWGYSLWGGIIFETLLCTNIYLYLS